MRRSPGLAPVEEPEGGFWVMNVGRIEIRDTVLTLGCFVLGPRSRTRELVGEGEHVLAFLKIRIERVDGDGDFLTLHE